MRGYWNETRWRLDDDALILPNGRRITLVSIRDWQADRLDGRFDLAGKWAGWRIRQHWLIPPGATLRRGCISEYHLKHLIYVHDVDRIDLGRRQMALF